MARSNAQGPSTRGYFKKLLLENPGWLEDTDTTAALERWKQDHPGQELTQSIRSGLSNIKSHLKRERGLRKSRKNTTRTARTARVARDITPRKARGASGSLERLEVLIDSCLSQARQQEGDLHNVINSLRLARNTLIRQMGES